MKDEEVELRRDRDDYMDKLEATNAKLLEALDLPDMDYEEAERLIERTDFMFMAVQMPGNKINKADAAAFFLEGYTYAQKQCQEEATP